MTGHHDSLTEALSQSLPEGVKFNAYHISTPPAPCPSLYASPPNGSPEKTYCESHSLLTTIDPGESADKDLEVAVFAIELQIYTTAHLTTVFVSKADSTGYLSVLDLPRHARSVLQSIASAFISWIVRRRHRADRRLVLSLFARAQNQYLFPGSVENGKKHILDDRALVKWWCKTLDPVLREYAADSGGNEAVPGGSGDDHVVRAKAHLIVPGHDSYETQAFFPRSFRTDPPAERRWANSHPLRQIATDPVLPPRCLVPHFPDDPKTRFLNELDEELTDAPQSIQASITKKESPSKRGKGQWKSVRTLEQFWELMAFRQECSSGRLVGFIWIVFTPDGLSNSVNVMAHERSTSPSPSTLKRKLNESSSDKELRSRRPKYHVPQTEKQKQAKKNLTGPIHPRSPRVKSYGNPSISFRPAQASQSTTRYYHSPPEARGTLVLPQKAYDRVHEVLLRLDFSNLDVSKSSTRRWIAETGVIAGIADSSLKWGNTVIGKNQMEPQETQGTTLGASKHPTAQYNGATTLIARKKKGITDDRGSSSHTSLSPSPAELQPRGINVAVPEGAVNMLGGNLIRKKPRSEGSGSAVTAEQDALPKGSSDQSGLNILRPELVRKKAKS